MRNLHSIRISAVDHGYEYNPDLMRLYIDGGGGCLVKHFGAYAKDRVTIIGDLCATAKGYESLCFAQLQRKGQA